MGGVALIYDDDVPSLAFAPYDNSCVLTSTHLGSKVGGCNFNGSNYDEEF